MFRLYHKELKDKNGSCLEIERNKNGEFEKFDERIHAIHYSLGEYLVVFENEKIRNMTRFEMVNFDNSKLYDGEKIENGELVYINKINENDIWDGKKWNINKEKEKEISLKKIEEIEVEIANKKNLINYKKEIGLSVAIQEKELSELLQKHSDECQNLVILEGGD